MPNPSLLPEDDQSDDLSVQRVAALAQTALKSPNPPHGSEDRARSHAVAQFQEMLLASRRLHPANPAATPSTKRGLQSILRRIFGK